MKKLCLYAIFCMGALSCTLFSEPSRPLDGIPVKNRDWMLPKLPDGIANSTEIWTTKLELLEFHTIEPPDDQDPREIVWRLKENLFFFIVCKEKVNLGAPLRELIGPALGPPPENFIFVENATYVVKHEQHAWAVDLVLDKKGEFVSVAPLQSIMFLGKTIYMPDGRENMRIYRGKGEALFEAILEATGEDPRLWKAEDNAEGPRRNRPQPSGRNNSPAGNEEPPHNRRPAPRQSPVAPPAKPR